MDDLTTRPLTLRRHGRARSGIGLAAIAVAGALLAVACGGDDGSGAPVTPSAPATTEVVTTTAAAPPTTAPATSVAPSTTVAPTTTAAPRPTPTTVVLPVPAAPPADGDATEPVVELGRLAIPKLGVDRTLYEGIRIPTFDLGPGHWPGTAAPGAVGNMVIGGHRTSSGAEFRHLDQLVPGDEVIVSDAAGATYTYVVQSTEITGPFAAQVIYQTPAKTATLFACHPPGSVRERIVVHLDLVG